jgi:hypothetical protein
MTFLVAALVAIATMSIGLRISSFFVSDRVHPIGRLMVAIATGTLISAAILQAFSSYRVFDFGLGLLISLSPVGLFDLAKWWFGWRRR